MQNLALMSMINNSHNIFFFLFVNEVVNTTKTHTHNYEILDLNPVEGV